VTGELTKAGRYDVVEVLHRGPRATLYVATRADLDRDVILKVPNDAGRVAGEWPTRDLAAASRLIHRHIVRIFEIESDGAVPYIAMERLHGRTLEQVVSQSASTADVHARADLVAQLCLGLHYAHEQQVVHGNVRPDHVVVGDDGAVKILNFGAMPSAERTLVTDNALAGSFEYMSPEQIIGRDTIDGRSDIFSAAVILYELVSGRRPFQGASTPATLARILRDEPAPLEGHDRLNAVLRLALQKDPAKRFTTAQEFAYALWMLDMPEGRLEDESQAVAIVRRPGSSNSDTETAEQAVIPMPQVEPESRGSKLSAIMRKFWSR
jgi:serine/threonine-protein kinase